MCGNSGCQVEQDVLRIASGQVTSLGTYGNGIGGWNRVWSRRTDGENFDRWVFNAGGRVIRSVAKRNELVDAWSSDGKYAAVQDFGGSSTGAILTLVSAEGGQRSRLYSSIPPNVCGACPPVVYQVAFAPSNTMLAFVLPAVLTPTNSTVPGGLFLVRMTGGSPAPFQIRLPPFHQLSVIDFTADGASMLLRLDRRLYSYDVMRKSLTTLSLHVDQDNIGLGLLPAVAFHA
jgi:hypothetical protein